MSDGIYVGRTDADRIGAAMYLDEPTIWALFMAGCMAGGNYGPLLSAEVADKALEEWRKRWGSK